MHFHHPPLELELISPQPQPHPGLSPDPFLPQALHPVEWTRSAPCSPSTLTHHNNDLTLTMPPPSPVSRPSSLALPYSPPTTGFASSVMDYIGAFLPSNRSLAVGQVLGSDEAAVSGALGCATELFCCLYSEPWPPPRTRPSPPTHLPTHPPSARATASGNLGCDAPVPPPPPPTPLPPNHPPRAVPKSPARGAPLTQAPTFRLHPIPNPNLTRPAAGTT